MNFLGSMLESRDRAPFKWIKFMDFWKKGLGKNGIAISKLSENQHEFNTPGR